MSAVNRNMNPVQSSYHMSNEDNTNILLIMKLAVQKHLSILITADLKWNQQVNVVVQKPTECWGL